MFGMSAGSKRKKLYKLLGDLPDRNGLISVKKITEEETGGYILEKLMFDFNGKEPVHGYFARPLNGKGKTPAILYNHAHGGNYKLGKDELTEGRSIMQKPPYAEELTKKGYSVLCVDAWAFGERRGRSESEIFKQMLWSGQVMWGMMVYDSLRAIDYLVSRPDVDAGRIGTMGMSMGSTMSWWVAALDTRVKVCVDICCLTDFRTLADKRGLDGHGVYYYVPKLLKYFSTADINALIFPRAHLSLAGNLDQLTPAEGLEIIDGKLKEVYKDAPPGRWKLLRYDVGHQETPEMRKEALAFLDKWL